MYTKKLILASAALVLTSLGAIAQTDSSANAIIKKEISVTNFTGIKSGGTFNIVVGEGPVAKVVVETCPANQENISAVVTDEKLVISSGDKKVKNCKTKIYVNAPVIQSIQLTGSTELKSDGELVEDKLSIKMSGASEANLKLNVKDLNTDLSGASELKLSGTANTHTTDISGAAELKAIDLNTQNTTAQLSGAGDARVNAKNELNAKISGAASISYKEEPAVKNIDVSGAGSASKKDGDTEIAKSEMDVNGDSDTTRFSFKDKKIIIIDGEDDEKDKSPKKEKKNKDTWNHWSGVELGFNGILNSQNETDLGPGYNFLQQNYGKSYHVGLNFLEKDLNLYKNKINLVTGMGLEFENYSLKNKVMLIPDTNTLAAYTTNLKYDKNKLRANYLTVPLLVDFNTSTKKKNNWHFTTGIIAAWRYSSFTKQVYNFGGNDIKTKVKDNYDLNDFKFSATVRAGYRGINLFANYGLNTLFNKSNNPDLYPITVGITLVPFD